MSRTPRTDESTSYYQPITTATRQSSIKRPLPPVPPISSSYHQHQHQPHQQQHYPYPYPQTSNHFQPNQFHPQPQHFQSQTQFQPYPYYQQPQNQWSQTPIRNPSSQAPPLPPPPTPHQVPKSLPSHPISIPQETFEQPTNPYYPTPFPISSHSHPSINPLSRTLSTNHSSHFSPKRNLPNLPSSSNTNPSIAINPISSNQTQDGSYHSTSNRITRTGSLQGARPLPNQETVHQPLPTTPSKPLPAPPSDPNIQRTYQETPSTFSNLIQPSRPASKPTAEPFEITISSSPELTVVPSVPVLKIDGIDEESEDESINQSKPTITLSSTPEPGTNSVPVPIIVTTEEQEEDSLPNHEPNPSSSKARPTPVPLLITEPSPSSPVPVPTSQVSDPISSTEPNQLQSLFCGGCHQLIAGRIVNALNQRWHPDCFKCEHCLMVLEHVAFYEHQGKAYCGVDYDEFFSLKCHHCNTSITDESYVTLDEPNLIGSPRHYHQLHLFCAECGDPFLDPKSLEESSRISKRSLPPQPQQPNQSTVKKMIEPNPFVLHKGYPYCESCHLKLHKPKCFGCKTSMVGDIINAMGKQWHEDCFVCKDCKKPFLNGMFFLFQSNPFCEPCYSVQLKQTF